MSIRAAVNQYIASRPRITALVATRVHPIKRPQNDALPAIMVKRVSGGHGHNLDAASSAAEPTFLISVFASTVSSLDEVAEAVRQEMQSQGRSNLIWGSGRRSVHVTSVTLEDESDDYEQDPAANDDGCFRTDLTYTIQHREPVPEVL